MIIMHVTYSMKPGQAQAYLAAIAAAGIDVASRREAGNLQYDYFYAAQQADQILLVERWESAEALAQHKQTAHFQQLGTFKDQYVKETAVQTYTLD